MEGQSYYDYLMKSWASISQRYPGFSLEEIRGMSPRERLNWLALSVP